MGEYKIRMRARRMSCHQFLRAMAWHLVALLSFSLASAWAEPQDDLWRAAEKGDRAAITRALKAGAKINIRDTDGWTALMFAASNGETEAVAQLLSARADANIATKSGQTPLMGAVVAESYETVKALVDAGAQVGKALPSGKTAVDLARDKNRTDLVTLLSPAALATASSAKQKLAQADAGKAGVINQKAELTQGLDVAVIHAYLMLEADQKQKMEGLQGRRQQVEQRQAQALAQTQQVRLAQQAKAQGVYDACVAELEQCTSQCESRSTAQSTGALLGGIAAYRSNSMSGLNQANSIARNSVDNLEICQSNCKAANQCEILRP